MGRGARKRERGKGERPREIEREEVESREREEGGKWEGATGVTPMRATMMVEEQSQRAMGS